MAPQREPPPSHQGLDQTLSQLGQTFRKAGYLRQTQAQRDGTKQEWVTQGLQAIATYLEQWSPVP